MNILTEYDFGDLVYLKTDPEQLRRMVTSFKAMPGTVLYGISLSDGLESFHYDIEITDEKTLIL